MAPDATRVARQNGTNGEYRRGRPYANKRDFPSLWKSLKLDKGAGGTPELYDVKFYPYGPDTDPVFAVTGGRYTLICRIRDGDAQASKPTSGASQDGKPQDRSTRHRNPSSSNRQDSDAQVGNSQGENAQDGNDEDGDSQDDEAQDGNAQNGEDQGDKAQDEDAEEEEHQDGDDQHGDHQNGDHQDGEDQDGDSQMDDPEDEQTQTEESEDESPRARLARGKLPKRGPPPRKPRDGNVDVLRVFYDEDRKTYLNSLAWTYDPDTNDPLICVSGGRAQIAKGKAFPTAGPSNIKILNVRTGKLVQTLTGHGGEINDLTVSPKDPRILASASADYTIRLWYLDEQYKNQPCAAILAGLGGHTLGVLSLCFHPNGEWLLSGGFDSAVKLWKVPDLPNDKAGTDYPTHVPYPYFSSTEIHHEKVDSLAFYGDLILSKCPSRQGRIVLWRILGFDASRSHEWLATERGENALPPKRRSEDTSSAFGTGWQQLLSLRLPNSNEYFLRFGLFHQPDKSPLLGICNMGPHASAFFWDLKKIEFGEVEGATMMVKKRGGIQFDACRDIGGAFKSQSPHRNFALPVEKERHALCYGVAWDNSGKWCVLSGDHGRVHVCRVASA